MSKSLYTLSKPSIEYLCGLIRDLSKVSEGIDDLNIKSDGVFSSLHVDTLLKALKSDCNDYTDKLVSNLSRLELKIVTNEADINKSNVLYLHKPDGATSYNQYVVIEGNKVLLGTTDISMTDYYTITQADAKFALKTTIDTLTTEVTNIKSDFNTHKNDTDIHTSADEKASYVKKTDITTTIDSLSTDTQYPSAKAVKTELDKKVDKTSIVTTTINSSSTDAQVPSAKSIYYNCIEGIEINQTIIDTYGTEILKYPLGIWRINSDDLAIKFTDLPIKFSGRIEITSIDSDANKTPWNAPYSYRVYNFETYNGENYIRKIENRNTAGVITGDTGWRRLCTTSVADVPSTPIISEDTDITMNSSCVYQVVNGICYIKLWGFVANTQGKRIICTSLPKSKTIMSGMCCYGDNGNTGGHIFITENGKLYIEINTIGRPLYGTLLYPVSES